MNAAVPLIVSVRDARKLEALLANISPQTSPVAELLEGELARAEFREPAEIPPDVVTMNSEVVYVDESSGIERTLRLVYPQDAGREGCVSVLAPVGAALLGLALGRSIDWPMPGGRTARLTVNQVRYQPKQADYPNESLSGRVRSLPVTTHSPPSRTRHDARSCRVRMLRPRGRPPALAPDRPPNHARTRPPRPAS